MRRRRKKERAERAGYRTGSYLPFRHRFQQRRLYLRRRPVQLIGQENIGKDRAFHKLKRVQSRIKDFYAGYIIRQKIGCALDTLKERRVSAVFYQRRKRFDQRCFSNSRNIFQQYMPAGQICGNKKAKYVPFPLNHLLKRSKEQLCRFFCIHGGDYITVLQKPQLSAYRDSAVKKNNERAEYS